MLNYLCGSKKMFSLSRDIRVSIVLSQMTFFFPFILLLLSGHTYASAVVAMSGTLLDIFDRPIIYKSVRYIDQSEISC